MQILTYSMFGNQARVFPFRPNWASPVTESLEWKTDIMKARGGLEQRRALRIVPRRGLEYRMLLKGEHAPLYEALMWGWQHRHFAVPVWTDIGRLTAGAEIDDTVLALSTDTLGFRADDFAILYASATSYEVVELASLTSDSLTVKDGLTKAWPAGTKVFPLMLSHLATSVSAERHTSAVAESTIAFNASGDTAYDFIDDVDPDTLYDGIEVITASPNWGATISNEFTRDFDVADAGVGPIAYYSKESTGRIVKPFQWLLKTRADIIAFRNLMGRLRGQAKTVWMPSWHDDFSLASSNALDHTKLTVKGTAFYTLVGVDSSRNRLRVRLPNGSLLYRRITAMTPNYSADTTQLQLDSTLGTTISVGDNNRIGLLLRCRLASDKVVIPWQTDRVATPQTTFTTVKL